MSGVVDMSIDDYNGRRKRRPLPPRRVGRNQQPAGRGFRPKPTPYERPPPRGDINGQWSHDLFEDGHPGERHGGGYSGGFRGNVSHNGNMRLVVENLFYEVTQDDLQELFSKCGTVKKVFIHYDRAGRSTGVADITFEDPADAAVAIRRFDGVALDGQEMKIKYAPFRPGPRVQSGRPSGAGSVLDRLGPSRGGATKPGQNNIRSRIGRGGSGSSGRGRGGGPGDSRRRTTQQKPITQDDLDADLDAYMAVD